MRIWNWGWHGSKTDDWWTAQNNTSVWSAKNAIPAAYKPDLIIGPALMTNDFSLSNNVPVATYKANIQGLLDAFLPQSDVLLLASGPRGDANAPTPAVQAVFQDALRALASENGLASLAEYAAIGADQTAAEALGFIGSDHIHKTALGHAGTARMAANAILAMA